MADPRRSGPEPGTPLREPPKPREGRPPRGNALVDLDVILDELAERVAERLAQHIKEDISVSGGAQYYSASNNPLGSRRAFLDAARRGAFPSYKAGRTVLARREDVQRWIESRPRKQRELAPDDVTDRELLERAGVRLRGKGNR